jgi:hypothetical protein
MCAPTPEGLFPGFGPVQTKAPAIGGEAAGPTTTALYSQDLRSLIDGLNQPS